MKIRLITSIVVLILQAASAHAQLHTHQDYIDYMNAYNKTQFTSHHKLTLMHKRRNMEKLGKETVSGDVSGTLSYKTKLSGFSGVVIMKYTNYSDDEDWMIDGYTNIKANIRANGRMYGTVDVYGKYPGKIVYDNLLIKKGNAGGGYYIVMLSDGTQDNVLWDEILNEKIANETEDEE